MNVKCCYRAPTSLRRINSVILIEVRMKTCTESRSAAWDRALPSQRSPLLINHVLTPMLRKKFSFKLQTLERILDRFRYSHGLTRVIDWPAGQFSVLKALATQNQSNFRNETFDRKTILWVRELYSLFSMRQVWRFLVLHLLHRP